MMSYDAMISTYEKDIRDKDAEIARLRAERDAARADVTRWQDKAVSLGMDNLDTAIAWGADAANLRAQLAIAHAERDAAREALEQVLADIGLGGNTHCGDNTVTPHTVEMIRVALSRLSSLGAQQIIESGEGPGPSTLAVALTPSPSESRRGGPVSPSPSKGEGDIQTVLAQLATARERVDYYAHLMPASVAQSLRDAVASLGAQQRAGEDGG